MEVLFQRDPCIGDFTGCDAEKFVSAMFHAERDPYSDHSCRFLSLA